MLLVGTGAGGCAVSRPDPRPKHDAAAAWQATLPHDGQTGQVAQWWTVLNDPVLSDLVRQAQQDNPNAVAAASRIDQARSLAVIAGAQRVPGFDGRGQLTRAYSLLPPSVAYTLGAIAVDASWELDLFGRLRHGRDAAVLRHEARVADWHDLRVTLAADVATAYVNLRLAEALAEIFAQNLASQARSSDLTHRKVVTGFLPPSDGALAQARAAESSDRLKGQIAQVDLLVKALVELTGIPEPDLRSRLRAGRARLPEPGVLRLAGVPADALAQRADLVAIEREMAAAASDVGVARADRYPRIALSGSIGLMRLSAGGQHADGKSWSIGPVMNVPLFDAGRRSATVDRAQARFEELSASYRARALHAVREVEESLVRLDAAQSRIGEMRKAADAFGQYQKAAESRYGTGSGTLFEQEEARRMTLSAAASVLQLRAERLAAWISVYKAAGGGWQVEPPPVAARTQGRTGT